MNNLDRNKSLIDTPISSSKDDFLERTPLAFEFADIITELDASKGLVVGICGDWGNGKTSFLNIMRERFQDKHNLTVVDFNPWMFSGADQLLLFFFKEIGESLGVADKKKFGSIVDKLAEYSGVINPISSLIPIPGVTIAANILTEGLKTTAKNTNASKSRIEVRNELTKKLTELDNPVVVIIDDIDRLSSNEIREIFKLVRLTANFPNVIYLLAFDYKRVVQALSEDGVPGEAFIEKIVQLNFELPQAPSEKLNLQVFEKLESALPKAENGIFDNQRFVGVFFSIISPQIANIRDVTRYAVSARLALKTHSGEIDLTDLLAIEAIRIFRPWLFKWIFENHNSLTSQTSETYFKDEIDQLLLKNPKDRPLIHSVISYLFPLAAQHLGGNSQVTSNSELKRAHRLGSREYCKLYFTGYASNSLVIYRQVEMALPLMANEDSFTKFFLNFSNEERRDIVKGLFDFDDQFTEEMLVPTTVVLLNFIHEIADEPQSDFYASTARFLVGQILYRIFKLVENEKNCEDYVEKILPRLLTYSSQLELLDFVGHRENIGHQFISKEKSEKLENELVNSILSSAPEFPEHEWNAWRVYHRVKEVTNQNLIDEQTNPILVYMLFKSTLTYFKSQAAYEAVKVEHRLHWDGLLEMFGSEATLRKVVDKLRVDFKDDEIINLADKYLSGWTPRSLF